MSIIREIWGYLGLYGQWGYMRRSLIAHGMTRVSSDDKSFMKYNTQIIYNTKIKYNTQIKYNTKTIYNTNIKYNTTI